MPLLEGIKCPVCGAEFAEGDDVVYCPDCGTPHHRECYKMAGHCVNAGLHHTGYNFYDDKIAPKKQEAKKEQPAPAAGFFAPQPEDKQTEGETPFSPIFPVVQPELTEDYKGETIDGTDIKDYAAAIRTNTKRYIPLFKAFDKKEKKLSWNWGALFFGPYYLLFRKMYPQGIGFLCLQTAIIYLGNYFASVKAPKFIEALNNIVKAQANSSFASSGLSVSDIQTLQNISDYQTALHISMITTAALIVLAIVTALFADRFYFKTVKNIVKSVNEKIKEGATFSATPTIMGQVPQNLDSDQMKYLYLAKRGGTTFFAPLLAYLALNLIQML